MSDGDLCALRCVSAGRKFMAQPGKRSSAGALSGPFGGDSIHAGRCRRIVVDCDALRGNGPFFDCKTHVLCLTTNRDRLTLRPASETTQTPGWIKRVADYVRKQVR